MHAVFVAVFCACIVLVCACTNRAHNHFECLRCTNESALTIDETLTPRTRLRIERVPDDECSSCVRHMLSTSCSAACAVIDADDATDAHGISLRYRVHVSNEDADRDIACNGDDALLVRFDVVPVYDGPDEDAAVQTVYCVAVNAVTEAHAVRMAVQDSSRTDVYSSIASSTHDGSSSATAVVASSYALRVANIEVVSIDDISARVLTRVSCLPRSTSVAFDVQIDTCVSNASIAVAFEGRASIVDGTCARQTRIWTTDTCEARNARTLEPRNRCTTYTATDADASTASARSTECNVCADVLSSTSADDVFELRPDLLTADITSTQRFKGGVVAYTHGATISGERGSACVNYTDTLIPPKCREAQIDKQLETLGVPCVVRQFESLILYAAGSNDDTSLVSTVSTAASVRAYGTLRVHIDRIVYDAAETADTIATAKPLDISATECGNMRVYVEEPATLGDGVGVSTFVDVTSDGTSAHFDVCFTALSPHNSIVVNYYVPECTRNTVRYDIKTSVYSDFSHVDSAFTRASATCAAYTPDTLNNARCWHTQSVYSYINTDVLTPDADEYCARAVLAAENTPQTSKRCSSRLTPFSSLSIELSVFLAAVGFIGFVVVAGFACYGIEMWRMSVKYAKSLRLDPSVEDALKKVYEQDNDDDDDDDSSEEIIDLDT